MTLNNLISIGEYQQKKRMEKRRKTLKDKIKIGMLTLSAAGFIGCFGAMWSNLNQYDPKPEVVVQYQELERKLQRSISASELMDNPHLGNDYLMIRKEYERITADQDRMSIVNDYKDSQSRAIGYVLLMCVFEAPLVLGAGGISYRRKRKESER